MICCDLQTGGDGDDAKNSEEEGVHGVLAIGHGAAGDGNEGVEDLGAFFGGGLEVGHVAIVATPRFGLVVGHLSFHLLVDLVSKDHKGYALAVFGDRLLGEFLLPAIEVAERLGIREVEHQDAAIRSLVEGTAQTVEPLLSCRVPDL